MTTRFGIAALLLVAACSHSPATTTTTTAEADTSGDAQCTSLLLVDPNADAAKRVCQGPWQFQQWQPTATSDPACGIDHYGTTTCYNSCADPSFGVADYNRTQGLVQTIRGVREVTCAGGGGPIKGADCKKIYYCDEFPTDCDTVALAAFQSYVAQTVPAAYTGNAGYSVTPHLNTTTCVYTCSITVTGLPDWNVGTGSVCGSYACTDYNAPVYKSCVNPNSPYTTGPVAASSAAGLSLSQVESTLHPDMALPVVCATGDDLPLDDPNATVRGAQVQALYDRLTTTLTALATAPNPSLRVTVVAKLKLLYELDAALLSATQIEAIVALYTSDPGQATECGTAGAGPSLPSSTCGDSSALQESYRLCTQLNLPHVTPAAIVPLFDRCVGLFEVIDALPLDPACEHDQLAAGAHTLVNQLLGKLLGAADSTHLTPSLHALNSWYLGVRAHFYGGVAADGLWVELDRALGTLWTALQAPVIAAGSAVASSPANATAASLEAILDQASSQMMALDRALLLVAFPDPVSGASPPLSGAPLAFLVGDALHDLETRLDDVAPLYDLGCRFGGFCSPSKHTEVSELWQLLASLPDGAAMSDALTGAADVRDWKSVFTRIQSAHAVLEAAANDALSPAGNGTDGVKLLSTGGPAALPAPLRSLAVLVQAASDRHRSYAATGVFGGTLRATIDQGIQDSAVAGFIGVSQRLEQQFAQQLTSFETNLQTLAGNLVNVIKQNGAVASIDAKLQQLGLQASQLVSDMYGMRAATAGATQKLGNFGKLFQQFLDDNILDPSYAIVRNPTTLPPSFTVNASDARYSVKLGGLDVGTSAWSPNGTLWRSSAKKGELLNVGVTGSWQPTCALQKANFGGYTVSVVNPSGPSPDLSGATTGPEGFMYQIQTGSAQVSGYSASQQESNFQTNRQTYTGCAGLNVTFFASVSSMFCGSADWGNTSTQSTTFDQNSHSSVTSEESFSNGLRLATTPFPDLPAGALVLVEIPAGAGSTLKSAVYRTHVLQTQRTFVFDKDVDLYLVVNDMKDPTCSVGGNLTVTTSHIVPQGALVQQLGSAMGATLAKLEQTFPTYLQEGHVTAAELAAFEADAQTALAQSCGCDPTAFQAPLLGFYNSWVAELAAQLQREAELLENERAQQLLQLQAAELQNEEANAQQQARLLTLLPEWTLRNLASQNLWSQTRAVVGYVNQRIWPVAHLRYAQTFAQLANAPGALSALQQLASAPFDSSFVQLAHLTDQAVLNINQQFDLNGPTHHLSYPRVALRFPRPGPSQLTSGTQVSIFRAVDPLRAKAVWDAIANGEMAPFAVTPADVYQLNGGASVLTCRDTVPAIHAASLVAVLPRTATGADQYNQENWRVPLFVDETLSYPTGAGLETYQIGPDLQNFNVRVLFANEDNFSAKYDAIEALPNELATLKIAEGLSPFSIFEVNLKSFGATTTDGGVADNPLAKAAELMLVLDLETQDDSLSWLNVCQ